MSEVKSIEIENVFPRIELSSDAKRRNSEYEYASIASTDLPEHQREGWEVVTKRGKYKTRVKRRKPKYVYTEDIVWTLLYRMGLPYLCGNGGAKIRQGQTHNQVDVFAYDDEVAVVVECKSAEEARPKDNFNYELDTLEVNRQKVLASLRTKEPQVKRKVGAVMVLHDYNITDAQRERAKNSNILLLDASAIAYYKELVDHVGAAARYQFYAELFATQEVSGLNLVLPAVQTRMGKSDVYTFAITPEHLLKIAFVAHKGRGNNGVAGMSAYQRMVNKGRLTRIKEYIDADGVFPTNIVVNFNSKGGSGTSGVIFDQAAQPDGAMPNAKLGWLHLPARYQSAWIIDGQHRLLAYSGHDKANKSFLNVTAYEGLDIHRQLELFTTINSEQKKVSANLLAELYAELRWNSDDEKERVQSIVSKTIQALNSTRISPFYGRILMSGDVASDTKCVSMTSMLKALCNNKFYFAEERKGKTIEYGALWGDTSEDTLKRTTEILIAWFSTVAEVASDSWNVGKAEGGYVATNNGVVVCISLLRNVVEVLDKRGVKCIRKSSKDLIECLTPYAKLVGEYFATRTESEMRQIRRKLGDAGQVEVRYMVMCDIKKQEPDFNPNGLDEWIARQAGENTDDALRLLSKLENRINAYVVATMQENFGEGVQDWWPEVPEQVRTKIAVAREQDNRIRGDKDAYLGYNDFRNIALDHWSDLFRDTLGFGITGNKVARTQWLEEFEKLQKRLRNEGAKTLQKEEYDKILSVEEWLKSKGI